MAKSRKKEKSCTKKEIPRGIIKLKPSLGEEDLRKFEAEEKKISEIIDVNLADKVLKTENKVRENITREDYDRMYKEYLKNNNIAHNKFIKLAFDRSNESKFFIIK